MAKIRIDKGFGERMTAVGGCGRQLCQTSSKPSRPPSRPVRAGSGAGKIIAAAGVVLAVIAASAAVLVGSLRGGDDSQAQTVSAADPTALRSAVAPAVSAAKPETSEPVAVTESRVGPGHPPAARATVRPAGSWRFDEPVGETAVDSAGTNHGVVKGAVRTQGRLKGALSFDGKDDSVATSANLANLSGTLTVSAWVKPDRPPSAAEHAGRIIANTFNYAAKRGWLLGLQYGSSDRLDFQFYSPAGTLVSATCHNFFRDWSNKWVHVAGTFKPAVSGSGGYLALYTNGVQAALTPTTYTAIGITNTNLRIGMRADVTGQGPWSGLIDEVAVYSEALSPEAILASATVR